MPHELLQDIDEVPLEDVEATLRTEKRQLQIRKLNARLNSLRPNSGDPASRLDPVEVEQVQNGLNEISAALEEVKELRKQRGV